MDPARPMLVDLDASVRLGRVGPEGRRCALAVLLTGRDQPNDPAVEQFLNFTRSQGLLLDELWEARSGPTLVASVLIVPSAGLTAMMFVSPVSPATAAVMPHLVRAASCGQDPRRIHLIQCLLDPHQRRQRQALQDAGFDHLATLVYMQRDADLPPGPLDLTESGITCRQWSATHRDRFARAILASYEGTLDCPGLLGLRSIDEVIEGHQATGRFDPQDWFVFYHGDDPVGVMLLSEVVQRAAYELVYLGLAPAFRGRGLARRILRFGLGVVHQRGASGVLLAVDEQNKPALRLYRNLEFKSTGRKSAMICALEKYRES